MADALQSNVFIVVYNSIFLGDFMLIIHIQLKSKQFKQTLRVDSAKQSIIFKWNIELCKCQERKLTTSQISTIQSLYCTNLRYYYTLLLCYLCRQCDVVPNELLFNFVLHVDLFRPLRQIAQFDEILFEFFPLFFELIFDLKRKLPTPLVPRWAEGSCAGKKNQFHSCDIICIKGQMKGVKSFKLFFLHQTFNRHGMVRYYIAKMLFPTPFIRSKKVSLHHTCAHLYRPDVL